MNEPLQAQTRARSRQIASRLEMRPMTTGQLLVSWRDLIQLADKSNIDVEVYSPLENSAIHGIVKREVPREAEIIGSLGKPGLTQLDCPACIEQREHTSSEYDQHHKQL